MVLRMVLIALFTAVITLSGCKKEQPQPVEPSQGQMEAVTEQAQDMQKDMEKMAGEAKEEAEDMAEDAQKAAEDLQK